MGKISWYTQAYTPFMGNYFMVCFQTTKSTDFFYPQKNTCYMYMYNIMVLYTCALLILGFSCLWCMTFRNSFHACTTLFS